MGGEAGGGRRRQSASDFRIPAGFDAAPTAVKQDSTAVMGGAYLGCNYQFGSNWVVGIEGDWTATDLKNSATAPNLFLNGLPVGSGGVSYNERVNWLANVPGRLGYAIPPPFPLSLTGAAALAHSD